ncbi:hypothetical protein GH714_033429 [Hevea brasiliensis]|uniref:Homeobox domain-containing protein n=1 Tax=Hevea brasiliensis TaxID=3981 RepID=A0A6A6MQP0_HEVBR|nr:hypothetical protein GH714_033429 [Hevea brasiliensis]
MKAVRDGVRFFKECPHPDDNQRRQLSKELGLEPRQIKFWFQNKRTQTKHEKVSALLAKYIGKPISQMDSIIPIHRSSLDFSMTGLANQRMGSPALDLELNPGISDHIPMPYQQLEGIPEMEKTLMTETAARAMEELIRLLRINEPLWIRSQSDGRYTIHRDSYDKVFPRAHHFKGSNARVESSKDSGMVTMNGMNLVEMFLDTNKWVDLFPTIVTRASIIQVLETGLIGNRSGSLQLQIEADTWVIADVSYDCLKENGFSSRSWRLPSGCMIQDMLMDVPSDDFIRRQKKHNETRSQDGKEFLFDVKYVRPARRHDCQCGYFSLASSLPQNVFNFFKDEKTRVQWDILSNGNPVHEIAHISGGAHPGNCISIIRPFIPSENNMVMLQESCTDPLGSFIVYAPIDVPTMNIAISGEDSSIIPILPSGFVISGDGRPDTGNGASTSANPGRSSGGSLLTVAFQILVSTPTFLLLQGAEHRISSNC